MIEALPRGAGPQPAASRLLSTSPLDPSISSRVRAAVCILEVDPDASSHALGQTVIRSATNLMGILRRSRRRALSKQSLWLPMRDGVRIAADVMRPSDDSETKRFPAVLVMTCYWRSFEMRVSQPSDKAFIGPRAPWADVLLERGYAVVVVDARGTGASEGVSSRPWSTEELADYGEVIDWIVSQPWSNGRVGALGHSYEGTAAMMLAASGHPAMRVAVAREFEFDLYPDILRPGGVFNQAFCRSWSENKVALDTNKVPKLFGLLGRLFIKGVRPVDEDPNGKELTAITASRKNPSVQKALNGITFSDDMYGQQNVTPAEMSVSSMLPELRTTAVPAQVWASWMDGTTADSALRLFDAVPSVREVRIGAWNHDGVKHASPLAKGGTPNPKFREQWTEWLRFLEGPLHRNEKPAGERVIRYFTMGEEKWKTVSEWPPPGTRREVLFLGPGGTLQNELPKTQGVEICRVHLQASTGTQNRWHTQLAGCRVRYDKTARTGNILATWTSEPLHEDIEITGHPEVRLFVRSTHDDGAFFAYLQAVDSNGRVFYLTEGILRAIHRGDGRLRPSFRREDARPMPRGEIVELRISLLPTSARIPRGWRIRLALAGADAHTFAHVPANESPEIAVARGAETPSTLVLPLAPTPDSYTDAAASSITEPKEGVCPSDGL